MKRLWTVLFVLCVIATSCRKEESVTDTATTDTAATDTTSTADSGVRESESEFVTKVTFKRLVLHVLGSGVQRAVVLNQEHHNAMIVFPEPLTDEVEATLGITCGSTCRVKFNELAFRIVDPQGNPLSGFTPSTNFTDIVTHLKGVPGSGDAFDTKEMMEDDIFAPAPVAGSVVGGFFELGGGAGDVQPFTCKGKFGDAGAPKQFPLRVHVSFQVKPQSMIEFRRPGGNWTKLATLVPGVGIRVDNDRAGSSSHFDHYARFSKKRIDGQVINLDDVKKVPPDCPEGSGDVPGCSNSQWP